MLFKVKQMLQSTLAAIFGVQSHKNRVRDYEVANTGWFVLAGITSKAIFVTTLLTVVNFVAAYEGSPDSHSTTLNTTTETITTATTASAVLSSILLFAINPPRKQVVMR